MITIRSIVPLIAVLCVSCTSRTIEPDANNAAVDDGNVGTASQAMFRPATLPSGGGSGDPCDDQAVVAPSVCEWANSVDAIVFGTVDAVRPLTSPVWVSQPPQDRYLADECDGGFVNIGVSFDLTVTEVLYGDAADEIVVHVGRWDMGENWGEQASLDEDGELEWHGRQTGILEPGTTVGMAITRVPDADVWSLMGELPFTFRADGLSRFVRTQACDLVPPDPLPADFTSLQDELDRCEVTTNDRHELRLFMYSPPNRSYAAECHIH